MVVCIPGPCGHNSALCSLPVCLWACDHSLNQEAITSSSLPLMGVLWLRVVWNKQTVVLILQWFSESLCLKQPCLFIYFITYFSKNYGKNWLTLFSKNLMEGCCVGQERMHSVLESIQITGQIHKLVETGLECSDLRELGRLSELNSEWEEALATTKQWIGEIKCNFLIVNYFQKHK